MVYTKVTKMKLTEVLWRWKKALPKGHLWRGKNKLYKKVTPIALENKIKQFEIEEQNMFYLRHPYLTIEQSRGHAQYFDHNKKFVEKWKKIKLQKYEHKNLGDRFGFLMVQDKWE